MSDEAKKDSAQEPTLASLKAEIDQLRTLPEWSMRWSQILLGPLAIVGVVGSMYALLGAKGEDGARGPEGPEGLGAPVGSIVAWPGPLPPKNSTWHDNWHVCDGAELVQEDYVELIAAYGGMKRWPYGEGDEGEGDDVVKLPDFRGMFLRGAGHPEKMTEHKSGELGERQQDALESHAHTGVLRKPKTKKVYVIAESLVEHLDGSGNFATGNNETDETDSEGDASEIRPVNFAVHWIIRVK